MTVTFEEYTTDGQAINGQYQGIDWSTGQCESWGGFGGRVACFQSETDTITLPAGKFVKSLKLAT